MNLAKVDIKGKEQHGGMRKSKRKSKSRNKNGGNTDEAYETYKEARRIAKKTNAIRKTWKFGKNLRNTSIRSKRYSVTY